MQRAHAHSGSLAPRMRIVMPQMGEEGARSTYHQVLHCRVVHINVRSARIVQCKALLNVIVCLHTVTKGPLDLYALPMHACHDTPVQLRALISSHTQAHMRGVQMRTPTRVFRPMLVVQ